MFEAIEKLNEVLTLNRTKFIAGNKVTIADFLFFHELTNLVYLGQDHDKYKEVKRWYADVYQIPEVKAITHEWFQVAKAVSKKLQTVEVIKAKL
jgi:glutathione S-transferase